MARTRSTKSNRQRAQRSNEVVNPADPPNSPVDGPTSLGLHLTISSTDGNSNTIHPTDGNEPAAATEQAGSNARWVSDWAPTDEELALAADPPLLIRWRAQSEPAASAPSSIDDVADGEAPDLFYQIRESSVHSQESPPSDAPAVISGEDSDGVWVIMNGEDAVFEAVETWPPPTNEVADPDMMGLDQPQRRRGSRRPSAPSSMVTRSAQRAARRLEEAAAVESGPLRARHNSPQSQWPRRARSRSPSMQYMGVIRDADGVAFMIDEFGAVEEVYPPPTPPALQRAEPDGTNDGGEAPRPGSPPPPYAPRLHVERGARETGTSFVVRMLRQRIAALEEELVAPGGPQQAAFQPDFIPPPRRRPVPIDDNHIDLDDVMEEVETPEARIQRLREEVEFLEESERTRNRDKQEKDERVRLAIEANNHRDALAKRYSRACGICTTPNPPVRYALTACGHMICAACVEQVTRVGPEKVSCPFCRADTGYVRLFEVEEVEEEAAAAAAPVAAADAAVPPAASAATPLRNRKRVFGTGFSTIVTRSARRAAQNQSAEPSSLIRV